MRAVYRNVHKRYRNASEIGVTATTIKYVREALLESRTLPEHLRKMEELAAIWDELNFIPEEFKAYGREIISMIYVTGMKDQDRNAYMAKEDQAAEVCERMMKLQGGDVDGLEELGEMSFKSVHNKTLPIFMTSTALSLHAPKTQFSKSTLTGRL